jgi:hypothetical protein
MLSSKCFEAFNLWGTMRGVDPFRVVTRREPTSKPVFRQFFKCPCDKFTVIIDKSTCFIYIFNFTYVNNINNNLINLIKMSAEPAPPVAPATEPTSALDEKKPVTSGAPSEPEAAPTASATEESKPTPSEEPAESKPTSLIPETVSEEVKPAATENPSDAKPSPASAEKTPTPAATSLSKLFAELPAIIKDAEHGEMWGIDLKDESHVPTSIVLEKFLRANTKDVAKAKTQLTEALKWRKKMQPMKLLADTEFDNAKFGELGYVSVYPKTDAHEKEIITWNIYGAVKDNKATFGNVEE